MLQPELTVHVGDGVFDCIHAAYWYQLCFDQWNTDVWKNKPNKPEGLVCFCCALEKQELSRSRGSSVQDERDLMVPCSSNTRSTPTLAEHPSTQ